MKTCSRCKRNLPLTDFRKDKTRKDGYSYWCSDCFKSNRQEHAEEHKEGVRKYYREHRSELIDHRKQYYETNKSEILDKSKSYRIKNIERIKVREKAYRERNREVKRQKAAEWRVRFPDRLKETLKRWASIHQDVRNALNSKRRAKQKGNGGSHTALEWKHLCDRYENKCLCCRRINVKLTKDHVVPIALGGSDSIDNIQPLCQSCNSKKKNKIIDYR